MVMQAVTWSPSLRSVVRNLKKESEPLKDRRFLESLSVSGEERKAIESQFSASKSSVRPLGYWYTG
jgi:hypothetical protein